MMPITEPAVLWSLRTIGLMVLIVAAGSPASPQGRIECGEVPTRILPQPVRYCAFLPPGYDALSTGGSAEKKEAPRYPILYDLHGLGDNEQSLMNTGAWSLIQDLREQGKIGEFLIVTPDGDSSFYINSHDGRVRYNDFFLREFIPAVERRYRVRAGRTSRGITGMSMGGYGALRLGFAHPELFCSVSAHSAALVAQPPGSSPGGPASNSPLASMIGELFGNPVDLAFWNANSPFALARKSAAQLATLRMYFDCGSEDSYGFDQGARALHEELDKLHVKHEFHIYPGGHGVEYLLAHVAASVEFHSRAFQDAR
jgi:S-formylglutathione hydrolase FrmB